VTLAEEIVAAAKESTPKTANNKSGDLRVTNPSGNRSIVDGRHSTPTSNASAGLIQAACDDALTRHGNSNVDPMEIFHNVVPSGTTMTPNETNGVVNTAGSSAVNTAGTVPNQIDVPHDSNIMSKGTSRGTSVPIKSNDIIVGAKDINIEEEDLEKEEEVSVLEERSGDTKSRGLDGTQNLIQGFDLLDPNDTNTAGKHTKSSDQLASNGGVLENHSSNQSILSKQSNWDDMSDGELREKANTLVDSASNSVVQSKLNKATSEMNILDSKMDNATARIDEVDALALGLVEELESTNKSISGLKNSIDQRFSGAKNERGLIRTNISKLTSEVNEGMSKLANGINASVRAINGKDEEVKQMATRIDTLGNQVASNQSSIETVSSQILQLKSKQVESSTALNQILLLL